MPTAVGQVGPQATSNSMAPGQQIIERLGNMGDLIVSELQARYYENTYRGNQFFGGNNTTATITTVGVAPTYTGLCLYNPAGTTVNLVLNKVGYSFLVAFAAAATIGLMVGWSAAGIVTATQAGAPGASSLIGIGAGGQGKCALSATLVGTPVLHTVFGEGLTGAVNLLPEYGPTVVDMEGSVILPPGAYAAIYTSTASGAASLVGSFQWSEVPR